MNKRITKTIKSDIKITTLFDIKKIPHTTYPAVVCERNEIKAI